MDKNVKDEIKVIDNKNDKLTVDDKITIKELEGKIESMKADKENKCKAAKQQLVDMLEVTVDKYRTATGTAEALRVVRFVSENYSGTLNEINLANRLAHKMASVTQDMANKAKNLAYAEMDQLCDGFYEKDFQYNTLSDAVTELAYEMMCIDLCRNVGGSAEDMVDFIKRVDEEIKATEEKLEELKKKED